MIGCIVALVVASAAPLTPEQEVEAWDPLRDGRDRASAADPAPLPPDDNAQQAFDAAGHVIAGAAAGLGVGAAGGLVVAATAGPLVGAGVFFVAIAAGPTVLLLDDLPLWAAFAAGAAVAAGGVVGSFSALFAALQLLGLSGIGLSGGGGPGYAIAVAAPVVGAVVGGLSAAIATTTIGAFAE